MAKKIGKAKNLNSSFKIPESFSSLNFNQKIIAVTLIVLVIGIIGSLFPGQGMTGGAIFSSNSMFSQIRYTLDNIIRTVFPIFPSASIIIYERFVLFLLLFALLSGAAKLLNFRGMTNIVVAGSISLISVWFIPPEVLAMLGVTYSSVYASLLMLIPIFTVGYLAWKIPGTRGGLWAKTIIYFILLVVFGATKEGISSIYGVGEWYSSYTDIIILLLVCFAIYYLIKALTINDVASQKARNKFEGQELGQSFAGIIVSETRKALKAGAKKYTQGPNP